MSEINEEEVQNNSENKNIKQQPQVVPVIDHRLLAGKLTVYNWMEDTPEGCTPSEIVEVRFKNTRKGFYLNNSNLKLNIGDIVAVEAALGHDIGIVSLTGELVREQMRLKKVDLERNPLKKIYRKAKPHDIEKWQQAIALEHDTMIRSRVIAAELGLDMKIGDVEYQGDKTKAIFYYIANDRVDFRKLIKILAETFHIRIEMKQIGARQEAGRIGGIGSCGFAFRYIFFKGLRSKSTFFSLICSRTSSPVRDTIPMSCPRAASTATMSPIFSFRLLLFK